MSGPSLLIAAPSAYTLGGLATWLDYLMPGLMRCGWEVTLGLVSGPRHHLPGRYLQEHPFDHTISIPCEAGTDWDRITAFRKVIRERRPDIVVSVNIPHALWATCVERAESGVNVRAVMTCHGIQADLFGDMRRFENGLDSVICTNRLACRLAVKLGQMDEDRVKYAAYGVNGTADPALSNDRLTIAWVGRLEQPQKRIHDLIEIADQLRKQGTEFRILVAGDGPEHIAILRRRKALGLNQQIELLGFVPADELPKRVYQQSQVILVTSHWETGPIVIWEAMKHGCAVVTSSYVGSGLEGALLDGENCLKFAVGDCESAGDALHRLAQDPMQRDQLAQCARQLVSDRYAQETSINQWNDVLRSICERPPLSTDQQFTEAIEPRGRLEHWFGAANGSMIRSMLGRMPPDSGPAGEWPHTIAGDPIDAATFWKLAEQLDRESSSVSSEVASPC